MRKPLKPQLKERITKLLPHAQNRRASRLIVPPPSEFKLRLLPQSRPVSKRKPPLQLLQLQNQFLHQL
jgi:hypothetical protein